VGGRREPARPCGCADTMVWAARRDI